MIGGRPTEPCRGSPFPIDVFDRVDDRRLRHGKLLIGDLEIRSGERVLDVGCGSGHLGSYVADIVGPTGRVMAVDPLPFRVELAQYPTRPNFLVGVGHAQDLGLFAAGTFDVLFYDGVFHRLPDKLFALREGHRVLRKGGRLGLSMVSGEQPPQIEELCRSVLSPRELEALEIPCHKVAAVELRRLFQEADFRRFATWTRSFADCFTDVDDVISFASSGSSSGSFATAHARLEETERARLRDKLAAALEPYRQDGVIRLEQHLLFAASEKVSDRC